MKKFFSDFKAFALKGNIVDMAIGVVIGGAFGKIVTSLVADIITPLIVLLTGKVSLSDLSWPIKAAVLNELGEEISPAVVITYGNFLQTVIDFLIIALSIFLVMKIAMNARKKFDDIRKKEEEEAAAAEEEAVEEEKETELSVLLEIRELLKKE